MITRNEIAADEGVKSNNNNNNRLTCAGSKSQSNKTINRHPIGVCVLSSKLDTTANAPHDGRSVSKSFAFIWLSAPVATWPKTQKRADMYGNSVP